MKTETTLMNYPVLTEVKVPARQEVCRQINPQPELNPMLSRQKKAALFVCGAITILAGAAMIYGLAHYGRIFQAYLVW